MVALVSRLIHQNTHTLRSRLVLFTAIIIFLTCSALSWYFVSRQIDSATDTLLRNGELFASQLAATTQYSVKVKDSRRIQELLQGALTLDDVSYIFVASHDNRVLGAVGTSEWKRLAGPRMASDWLPLLAARRTDALAQQGRFEPMTQTIRIIDGQPMAEASLIPSAGRWIAILFGSDRPHFYDIIIPIRNHPPSAPRDPALGLPLDEIPLDPESSQGLGTALSGVIEVGLTDRQHQWLLRQQAWQVALITLAIITIGIAVVVYLARRMTHPLHELSAVARQISTGDLSATATFQSADEIGELARVFNQMTASLRDREQELVKLNQTLEAKVESRTRDLKAANDRLQELDQLKTALVSHASHELRTPLTSIKVHVRNLLDGITGTLGAAQRENLDRVHANVERLRALIDDLLDLSRLQTGRVEIALEAVRLEPLLQEVVETLRFFSDQKRLPVTISPSDLSLVVHGDREKLRRIFTNVIHNAIKFTAQSGTIRIEARQEPTHTVLISIEDSGCGIAPEEQGKIFLPFYRSEHHAGRVQGSGLGLSIAKELIELHRGAVWVDSTIGKGSCFRIRLPTVPPGSPVTAPDVEPSQT